MSAPKWTQVSLQVVREVGPSQIIAYRSEIAPGLAIHPTQCLDNDFGGNTDEWTVTHARSGFAVIHSLPGRRAAQEAAKRLAAVTDWTRSGDAVVGDKKLIRDKRNAIANDLGGKYGTNVANPVDFHAEMTR